MPWQFSHEIEPYADRAGPLLAARPVANTVALTIIDDVRAGRRWSEKQMTFGWYDEERTCGAVCLTPPYELLLAEVPDQALDPLVAALGERGVEVPGVHGEQDLVDRFTAAWTARTHRSAQQVSHQRLYALAALRPPPVPGRGRPASGADQEVANRWYAMFQQETGGHPVDHSPTVRDRIGRGLLWIWADATGDPVALAARSAPAAGVVRVGPVFTPPEQRRRGYGAAVTAAATADALRAGAAAVVLFTDLANPTSNAIYQEIGYRPVADRKVVRFEE